MINKIYKFGGASVKDADAVKNLTRIVDSHKNENILLIVSAMGKTTNMLETVLDAYRNGTASTNDNPLKSVKDYHYSILSDLFDSRHKVYDRVKGLFDELEQQLCRTELPYDCHYDQTVSFGELISTTIVSEYLRECGIDAIWLDSRRLVNTDDCFRAAAVNWESTAEAISQLNNSHTDSRVFIAQGFIGGTADGQYTTTLGREGSDYTAAIFANILNAKEVSIWKDVEGLQNADPKRFSQTVKIPHISYPEAIELSFYGATIIHPKTIKPLQNKNIPLNVRSFVRPDAEPTVIDGKEDNRNEIPSYIVKDNQTLISFSPRDYSFMNEHNLQILFSTFDKLYIHANMVQTSALMLSICFDHDKSKLDTLLSSLRKEFSMKYNSGLQLFTIRHYISPDEVEENFLRNKKIIIKQSSRSTLQYVLKTKAQ